MDWWDWKVHWVMTPNHSVEWKKHQNAFCRSITTWCTTPNSGTAAMNANAHKYTFSFDSFLVWIPHSDGNLISLKTESLLWSVVFMPGKYCCAAAHVPRLFFSKKQILVQYIKLSGANVDFTLTSVSVNLPLCLYPIAVFVTVLFPFLYRHCLHLSVSLQPPSIVSTIPMVQHCMNMDHSEFE